MMSYYKEIWGGKLGGISVISHTIDFEPGTRPIMRHPYKASLKNRELIAEKIRKQLGAGVIKPVTIEWASLVVIAAKKAETLRCCVDYQRLNAKRIPGSYPLPRMDECHNS